MVVVKQIYIYLCSHCARVHNTQHEARQHEIAAHTEPEESADGSRKAHATTLHGVPAPRVNLAQTKIFAGKSVPRVTGRRQYPHERVGQNSLNLEIPAAYLADDTDEPNAKATRLAVTVSHDNSTNIVASSAPLETETIFNHDQKPKRVTKAEDFEPFSDDQDDFEPFPGQSNANSQLHQTGPEQMRFQNALRVQCEFCSKVLSSNKNYRQHRMIHTGERPHKCSLCPLRFIQKVSKRQHELSHHGVTTNCPHCELGFQSRKLRQEHILMEHPLSPYRFEITPSPGASTSNGPQSTTAGPSSTTNESSTSTEPCGPGQPIITVVTSNVKMEPDEEFEDFD